MNEPSGIAARTVAAAAASAKRGLELLLYGLQSPINIGMILRVAETYQFRVSIYDRHRALENPEKFGTIKVFCLRSRGAVGLSGTIEDDAALTQALQGRPVGGDLDRAQHVLAAERSISDRRRVRAGQRVVTGPPDASGPRAPTRS